MNEWQLLRQAKHRVVSETWDGSVKVWARQSVVIVPGMSEEFATGRVFPAVFLWPSGGEADREEPGLLIQRIGAALVVDVPADGFGEAAVIGANRQGVNSSLGRGLLELEEKLYDALGRVIGADGVAVQLRGRSAAQIQRLENSSTVVWRAYEFEGMVTADRSYPPPTKLASSVAGGTVALTWSLPPSRYDRLRVILRRASGSTPPASATDGSSVTLSGDLATSKSEAPGSGTWSYALFAAYDETGDGAIDRYSAAATKTVVVP